MPQLIAARPSRSISRFLIMHAAALPSTPTRFSAGMMHSSKTSSAVIEARIPHLSLICCPRRNPLVPFSTRNRLSPGFCPCSAVWAYTRKASPVVSPSRVPLVIHILEPLITYLDPPSILSALVRIPNTSVPAPGSDMHIPPISSPLHAAGRYLCFCSSVPFRARLLAKSREWARKLRQNAGSEADSSSCTMQAAVASNPAPPYSSGTVTPKSPRSPSFRNKLMLNLSSLLKVMA
mmetsp:Transcript_57236/g.134353  ORF Transcript_57236/g.134353 Transcript_57236/m.134353 type:complete len:235 (+) Transcript_57236:685-1389(+)